MVLPSFRLACSWWCPPTGGLPWLPGAPDPEKDPRGPSWLPGVSFLPRFERLAEAKKKKQQQRHRLHPVVLILSIPPLWKQRPNRQIDRLCGWTTTLTGFSNSIPSPIFFVFVVAAVAAGLVAVIQIQVSPILFQPFGQAREQRTNVIAVIIFLDIAIDIVTLLLLLMVPIDDVVVDCFD